MQLTETAQLNPEQKQALYRLWNQEYPEKLTHTAFSDFEKYLEALSKLHHFLLQDETGGIKGWAFSFDRENERWFAVLLSEDIQSKGHGSTLLNKLKERNLSLSGWVIDHSRDLKSDGQVYRSPLEFYLKNDYRLISEIRLETEKISAVKIVWKRE